VNFQFSVFVPADCSAAVSAAVRRASRPPRRKRDALGTAGKACPERSRRMPALR